VRALFVNENLGGHATVHLNIRASLPDHADVEASFFDLAPPGLLRKLVATPVPGLDRLDLDLQPLRFQLAQSAAVRRRLRSMSLEADVVHVYTHNVALLSAGLLRALPSVVSLDGTNAQNAYRLPYRMPTRFTPHTTRLAKRFEERVYDAATLVVTQSRWAARSVMSYGVDPDRIRVIPFGVTVPHRLPPQRQLARPRIVFVGRSLARKGGLRLLRLHRERLAELADLDLVTQDHVEPRAGVRVFNDVVPGDGRLMTILRQATVFAFPSEMDLSPNVVLEAMAAGLPVVALRVGAVEEMVEHGVSGLLVQPADDHGLVRAIESLVRDRRLAARMGAAGRERVLQRFDARVTTSTLIGVLAEARRIHAASHRSAGPAELRVAPSRVRRSA
jgi:starch synthase